jgi:hypothetical protein
MTGGLRGSAAIVGAAVAGIGEAPGLTSEDIAMQASVSALTEAGLTTRDVDGVFGSLPGNSNPLSALHMAEIMGIHPRFTDNNRTGGSSFLLHSPRRDGIVEGLCDTALARRQQSANRVGQAVSAIERFVTKPLISRSSGNVVRARRLASHGRVQDDARAPPSVAVAAATGNLNPGRS